MATTSSSPLLAILLASLLLLQITLAHNPLTQNPISTTRRRHHRLKERAQFVKLFRQKADSVSEGSVKQQGVYFTSAYNDSALMEYSKASFKFSKNTDGADITIDTSKADQIIDGFGAALTDASASLLTELKKNDKGAYQDAMDYLFNPRTGMRMLRVPMGSCDFSMSEWTYQDQQKDKFDLGEARKHQVPVLKDAMKLNPRLNIMLSPWSPPKWMKTIDNLAGGYLNMDHLDNVADYYANAAEAFKKEGITPSHMTVQNEPDYWGEYPSMRADAKTQSQMSEALRKSLDKKGLEHVKIIAHDNNYKGWGDAMNILKADDGKNVDGVGFHCYRGKSSQISDFIKEANEHGYRPEIHMTECSANQASQTRWNAMQWWLSTMFFPLMKLNSRSIVLWNVALDSSFGPHLPTAYCKDCTGSLTINKSGGDVTMNGQALIISHFSAATTDLHSSGGGYSRRVQTDLGSSNKDCIKGTQAFAAPMKGKHLDSTNSKRVGLVLQNDCGNTVDLKIALDGKAFQYVVSSGLTTLVIPNV